MGMTMPQGWSYLDGEGEGKFIKITGILELPIENVGTIEVSEKVTDAVNGVVFGEIKGEPGPTPPGPTPPTPSLTKIIDGSTIDGIEVNFDTTSICADFIANFGTIEPDTEWGKALVSRYDAEGNEPIITIIDMTGEGAVVLMIQDSGNTGILNQYWFTPNDLDMGGPIIPRGWNRIDSGEGDIPTVVPVSGNFSFNFPDGLQMVVDSKFTVEVNGVVFGAITE